MEATRKSKSQCHKSYIQEKNMLEALEGFIDNDKTFNNLLNERFKNMKKFTSPASVISLNIINSTVVTESRTSTPRKSFAVCEQIVSSTTIDANIKVESTNLKKNPEPKTSLSLQQNVDDDLSISESIDEIVEACIASDKSCHHEKTGINHAPNETRKNFGDTGSNVSTSKKLKCE